MHGDWRADVLCATYNPSTLKNQHRFPSSPFSYVQQSPGQFGLLIVARDMTSAQFFRSPLAVRGNKHRESDSRSPTYSSDNNIPICLRRLEEKPSSLWMFSPIRTADTERITGTDSTCTKVSKRTRDIEGRGEDCRGRGITKEAQRLGHYPRFQPL